MLALGSKSLNTLVEFAALELMYRNPKFERMQADVLAIVSFLISSVP